MKKTMMAAIAVAIAVNAHGQALIGSKHADTLSFYTNDSSRMYILPDGRVSVNGGPNYVLGSHATMAITKRKATSGGSVTGSDQIGLLLNDNTAHAGPNTQLSVINYYSPIGLYVYSATQSTNPGDANGKAISCEGGDVGYFRRVIAGGYSNKDYYGYINHVSNESGFTAPNGKYVSFESRGNIQIDGASLTDFRASEFDDSLRTDRYGLKLDFSNTSPGHAKAAWGVYQSSVEVKNHFNGTTLLGSTTDNGYDKAQVTGGTKTDGFGAAINSSAKIADYTLTNTDYTILADASTAGATITMRLPVNGVAAGKIFVVKKIDTSPNAVRVQPGGGNTIDGNSFVDITAGWGSYIVQFDGTNYVILAKL
jgi:hypothetical protein